MKTITTTYGPPARNSGYLEDIGGPSGHDPWPDSSDDEVASDAGLPTILVIDDDRDFLDSLGDLLEHSGSYNTLLAEDAATAVTLAHKNVPSIALIDVKLGQDNGIDLVPILKMSLPGLICVVMTAYRDVTHSQLAFDSGADAFLYKPLDPNGLFRTLRGLLDDESDD